MSSLRPPSTPRAVPSSSSSSSSSGLPTPLAPPSSSSRRKSLVPAARPTSSQSSNMGKTELDSLRQAVLRNDPARYDSPTTTIDAQSPTRASTLPPTTTPTTIKRPIANSTTTPATSSLARRQSLAPTSFARPTTPSSMKPFSRPKTPTNTTATTTTTTTPFGPASSRLGQSTTSDMNPPTTTTHDLAIGDVVTFDVQTQTMRGTLRFVGQVDGKPGQWAGVELTNEWRGQGKNDGSVKGVQYFACEPLCGLFLPFAKVVRATTQPQQSSPLSPVTPIASKITAGSRASKYLSMTASDLAANKKRNNHLTASSPTKPTPRRSISPDKASASSSMVTPKANRSRPSFGGPTLPTPSRRTSLAPGGIATATPRAGLSSSVKRPTSSMKQRGDVPPVPHNTTTFNRSVTPSSGRRTPSTPGPPSFATAHRRTSLAPTNGTHHLLDTSTTSNTTTSRPTTPSFRSSSRQSFNSSISKHSNMTNSFRSISRASITSSNFEPEELDQPQQNQQQQEELQSQLKQVLQREQETKNLLQASEKIGRELEQQLSDKDELIKILKQENVKQLNEQIKFENNKVDEMTQQQEQQLQQEENSKRLIQLSEELEQSNLNQTQLKTKLERLRKENETKTKAKDAENESLRERIEIALKQGQDERIELENQLIQLRKAGQSLCETYEEKISEIENSKFEALNQIQLLEKELSLIQNSTTFSNQQEKTDLSAIDLSASQMETTSAADVINAENVKADNDHLKLKLNNLEEQLEQTKMSLESEIEQTLQIKIKSEEVESNLRKEINVLKQNIDDLKMNENKLNSKIEELEEALLDSQVRLEEERAELESFRTDTNEKGNTIEQFEQTLKQNSILKLENESTNLKIQNHLKQIENQSDLIQQLKQEIQNYELDLDQLKLVNSTLQSNSLSSSPLRDSVQGSGSSIVNNSLSPVNEKRRGSIASNASKDELLTTKDQIVGLKTIITTLEQENKDLIQNNKSLNKDLTELRNRQTTSEVNGDKLTSKDTKTSTTNENENAIATVATSTNSSLEISLRRQLDQLQSKLDHNEKESQREIKALNQEVSELESLIESKIYREDELETELLKYKSMSTNVTKNDNKLKQDLSSFQTQSKRDQELEQIGCEMCGDQNHEIESCPIFAGSTSPTKSNQNKSTLIENQEFCDDCEEYGHSLENCPLANEIF
ncbi:hypothetical protein OIO90_003556 [Microbotryomycetes sp. JL221]|nr:hypothetical protein OIO90_003556 [Microbotryomycetes sp. JL221]